MAGVLEELDRQLDRLTESMTRLPEAIAMSTATMKALTAEAGKFSRADPAEPISLYNGIRVTVSDLVPDGELMVLRDTPLPDIQTSEIRGAKPSEIIIDEMTRFSTPFDPIVQGEGTVKILDDDGEWKEIGRVRSRDEVHRAVLSDPTYWKTIEEHAGSPEMMLTIAEVEVPAWVALRGGANAHEIDASLVLEHRIKRTTGDDRYHEVDLHLETERGTLTEHVHWSKGVRWPQPSDWHRALTDLGIIGNEP